MEDLGSDMSDMSDSDDDVQVKIANLRMQAEALAKQRQEEAMEEDNDTSPDFELDSSSSSSSSSSDSDSDSDDADEQDFVETPPDIKAKKVRPATVVIADDLYNPVYPMDAKDAPHLKFSKFSWYDQVEQIRFWLETGTYPFSNMSHGKKVEWKRRAADYFLNEDGNVFKNQKTRDNKVRAGMCTDPYLIHSFISLKTITLDHSGERSCVDIFEVY